jgi:general L-amino acid transport system permease protein
MAQVRPSPPDSVLALLRNQEVRAVIYQAAVILLVLAGLLVIVRNTLSNLEARGISSGFAFLRNEAGYDISEVVPIPQLQGGFLYSLISLIVGILIVVTIARVQSAKGQSIGENPWMALAVIGVIFVIPGSILYFQGHTIVTVTYRAESSYGIALLTGLFNTFKVSFIGCILATVLGLFIGIARLSSNWLVSRLAATYIEVLRNIPLLLQLFFWYFAVLRTLPGVRQSLGAFGVIILNNRGVYLPNPVPAGGFAPLVLAVFLVFVAIYFRARQARIVQERSGEQLPVLYPALAALMVVPVLTALAFGKPFEVSFPVLEGFNFRGGLWLSPEYAALLAGLVLYTAAFIAEIVRSGIQAVSKGQREAALAVGLRKGLVMRLVILPQALRVIVPPLTSQYLNLTKNSSLAVAIGYPDLVSVGGTTLNQSGQAIEVIGITMLVYLTFSLGISVGMNWYNARVRLVER